MRPDFQFQGQAPDGSGGNARQKGGNFDNPKNFSRDFQDGMGGKPDFANGAKGMRDGKNMGNSNILSVLATYLSITGVFVVLTYYMEKLLLRRKAV